MIQDYQALQVHLPPRSKNGGTGDQVAPRELRPLRQWNMQHVVYISVAIAIAATNSAHILTC